MTTISIDERLQITAELDDHPDEPRHYALASTEAGFDRWALTLTRLDTGEAHHVALTWSGSWACDCKAHKYRKVNKLCRHALMARSVRALLDLLAPCPAEQVG